MRKICEECKRRRFGECPFIINKLETYCDKVETYDIGYEEAIAKAVDWLYQRQTVDLEVPNIENFINDLKKTMKQ